MQIKDRTFVISGGASGLGRATAELLHQNGASIVILDMSSDSGQELVSKLGSSRAIFHETDVSSSTSIALAVEASLAFIKKTGHELGGVIPAAGVALPAKMVDKDGHTADMEQFDFVMNINVRGSVDLVRQFLPYWIKRTPEKEVDGGDAERGVVVLVASSAAFDGQPGQVAYSASKGAIASLTFSTLPYRNLSIELIFPVPMTRDLARYGIRVVTIAPSLFESRMTSMMSQKVRNSLLRVMEYPVRPGQPNEFASLVKHSIENQMLNGTVLRLDGGMRMPSKM